MTVIAEGDEQSRVWDQQCISKGLVCSEDEKNQVHLSKFFSFSINVGKY